MLCCVPRPRVSVYVLRHSCRDGSLHNMGVGIELRSSGLAASAFLLTGPSC